jgi:hypothetical protein
MDVWIFCTYHPDTLYLREQVCEYLWLFFEAKRGPRAKIWGKTNLVGKGFGLG